MTKANQTKLDRLKATRDKTRRKAEDAYRLSILRPSPENDRLWERLVRKWEKAVRTYIAAGGEE
jgi:hypothetical protein